jgi:16S rRNA (cytosine967-C5)-methyltransferase
MEEFAGIEPPLDLTVKQRENLEMDNAVKLPFGGIRLPSNIKINTLPYFDDGFYWAQDAASTLAVKCLGDITSQEVLDLCAAPGGKTAQLLDAGANVTAVDISDKRLQKLKENMERLHFTRNLEIICTDALCFESLKLFDVILIDAPCSATGTFRRHPEIMNTKTINDVKKMANLQQKILEHAALFLKSGGKLVYATCSLAKEEGEKQICRFVKAHPEYKILPIDLNGTENMRTKEGFLRILPQHLKIFGGIDGFFVAVLQRNF